MQKRNKPAETRRPLRAEIIPHASAFVRWIIPLLVFGSGISGLTYESLWMRSLGLVFGNTTDAVAFVLATFMAGLAGGSAIAGRLRVRNALAAYAVAEGGAGICVLLSVGLLPSLPHWYSRLVSLGYFPGPLLGVLRIVLAAAIVMPATLLLGAAFPYLMEVLAGARQRYRLQLGRLYAINTFGGVVGVILATYILVPGLGVRMSFCTAAAINLIVGITAWRSGRRLEAAPSEILPAGDRQEFIFAAAAVLSGASAFGLEILWTRSYTLILGSSVYAFNVMLASFLIGIVFGAALYTRFAERVTSSPRIIGYVTVALSVAILASAILVGWLPIAYFLLIRVLPLSFAAHQAAGFMLCLASMSVITTGFGLLFPLLTHFSKGGENQARETTGFLYAWNTAGAILGIALTDLLFIPHLGLQRSYVIVAAFPLGLGLYLLISHIRTRAWIRVVVPFCGLAGFGLLVYAFTPWNAGVITSGAYRYAVGWREQIASASDLLRRLRQERRILFYREGREAVVSVAQSGNSDACLLAINGKTDASSEAQDVVTQKLIAHVPLLLHPAPKSALVIGWGTGATAAAAALHGLERVDCAEIEAATYEAAPFFESLNGNLIRDPRFRIFFEDGRTYLLTRPRVYDAIMSEPSNPWISGVSNLFTRDFYEVANSRLAPDGMFCQWFHFYHMRLQDLIVQVKTFLSVFPYANLWMIPPARGAAEGQLTADMLLIGSRAPLVIDFARLAHRFHSPAVQNDLLHAGVIDDELSFLACYALGPDDMQRLCAEGEREFGKLPLNTDDHPVIEFAAPMNNVAATRDVVAQVVATYARLTTFRREDLPPVRFDPPLSEEGLRATRRQMAAAYRKAGMLDRALSLYRTVLAAEPQSAPSIAAVGEILLARGEAAQGTIELRRSLELDPLNDTAWDALGTFYFRSQHFDEAIEAFGGWVRHRPGSASAHYKLGALYAQRAEWGKAREELRLALTLDPQNAKGHALLDAVEAQAKQ